MIKKMRRYLTPPIFRDEEENRKVQLLHILLLTMFVTFSLVALIFGLFDGFSGGFWLAILVLAISLICFELMGRGYLTLPAVLMILAAFGFLAYLPFFGEGIHDTALVAYPALILITSLLLSRRLFAAFVLLLILSVGLIAYAELLAGLIVVDFSLNDGIRDALMLVLIILVVAISARLLTHQLVDTITRARWSEGALTEINQQLHQEIARRRETEATLRNAETLLMQRNLELDLLNRIGQELNAMLDSAQVNERLLEIVVSATKAESAAIWLTWDDISEMDEEDTGLICRAVFHINREHPIVNVRLQPGQGLAGWASQNHTSLIVNDVSNDDRFYPGVDALSGNKTRSLLTVPLSFQTQIIGVLQVANKIEADFSDDDLTFVRTLATSAVIAMQNARSIETLRLRTKQLEQQNEELDTYAHTVAHDLKTPLARMVGFAEFLEVGHADMSDQERGQYLQMIAQNGRKMIEITNELLLLAGVRRAKTIELTPLTMAVIIQEVQERLAGLLESVAVQIVLPDIWPTAIGYAPWIEEVWVNYVSNAIKYGGQPPHVELGVDSYSPELVRFWVRDNGLGLTVEEQKRLFTPLTRLDMSGEKGHGLGLSIVRRVIEKLGGQVGVESGGRPGGGCKFWFTLPAAPSTQEPNSLCETTPGG